MIGDRLDTDIAFGKNGGTYSSNSFQGLHTLLVLTGVTTRQDLAHAQIQPDKVIESLGNLFD